MTVDGHESPGAGRPLGSSIGRGEVDTGGADGTGLARKSRPDRGSKGEDPLIGCLVLPQVFWGGKKIVEGDFSTGESET